MSITAISLQSGSNGNCIFVESNGVRLLLDAGISGSQAQKRLAQFGRDIRDVDAVLISHDHSDHVRHAGVFQRKFGLPVYMTHRTMEAAGRRHPLGPMSDVRYFAPGASIQVKDLRIESVATPHDAVEGVAFVVDDGCRRLGVLTDLGHPFRLLHDVLRSLDAALLESNYDPHMLQEGPYPYFLKRRIAGPQGHLSNADCASLLREAGTKLRWACLAHLSEQNNEPHLALRTNQSLAAPRFPLHVASRYAATGLPALE